MADGITVLIVEDEPALADAWQRLLELAGGYRVEVVHTGREALDRLEDAPDVVVLDRNLGEVSGDDVLAAIRDAGLDCGVVVTSGIDPSELSLDHAADAYLVKPVPTPELLDTIDSVAPDR